MAAGIVGKHVRDLPRRPTMPTQPRVVKAGVVIDDAHGDEVVGYVTPHRLQEAPAARITRACTARGTSSGSPEAMRRRWARRREPRPKKSPQSLEARRQKLLIIEMNVAMKGAPVSRHEQAELRRRGFLKRLPCLRWDRPLLARNPGERVHDDCRRPAVLLYELP